MAVSRYFKGDIVMASVDGHGTDTYVYLQVLYHNWTAACILSFSEAVPHGNGEPACVQLLLQQQTKEHLHPGKYESRIAESHTDRFPIIVEKLLQVPDWTDHDRMKRE